MPRNAPGHLLSPWLDLTQSGEAYDLRGPHDPMVTRDTLQMMATLYCGDAAPTDPLISPLNADLAGLPLLIQVGTDEVLLGDSIHLAHRAALSAVDVTLRVWPEMVQAWPLFHQVLPTAGNAAIAEARDWIASRFKAGAK